MISKEQQKEIDTVARNAHNYLCRAAEFAAWAYHGLTSKYDTSVPYVLHPLRVAARVGQLTTDSVVVAAAMFHDAIEDTVGLKRLMVVNEIKANFGQRTLELVLEVTDVYVKDAYQSPEVDVSTMKREQRKALEAQRIAGISKDAQLIKAYDMIDNTESIVVRDKDFARVYVPETRRISDVLTKLDPHARLELDASLAWAEAQLEAL